MYRNRSPNLFIILIIVLATNLPVPHSHATEELKIPDPLTLSFCEETLSDPRNKNLLEKDELEQCQELAEIEKMTLVENENSPTPETPPTESEDLPTPETPPTESEDLPTPETPPTESEDLPTTETPPTESEDLPTPETPPTENEDSLTPETSPTKEDKLKASEQPKPTKEKQQTIAPTLAGVALLGISSLSATYSAETKTITLENTVSGLLNLNLTSGYIIFQLPKEVMQSIDSSSLLLQYRYSGVLGSQTRNVTVTIDRANNQVYADVSAFLKLSLLSRDRFTLSFKVGNLPIGVDKVYTFRSVLADGLVDLNLLSSGTATATLGIGPTFNLIVPNTLNFGNHELTGREKIIPRLSPMTISISHENAAGYNWKLQASLSRPLTSTDNDVLSGVLYFKTTSKTQLLQANAIEIATGTMSSSSNQTPLTYEENEGLILDLTGKYPKPSSYSADIQWSLINAP